MSVTTEHWRAAIGYFRGGRSGFSSAIKTGSDSGRGLVSRGCATMGLLLASLIISQFLLV